MAPDEAIYLLRRLGLTLEVDGDRLHVSPGDLVDDDVDWLLRTHKAEIIAELLNDGPRPAWRVRLNDGASLDIFCHPEVTRDQLQAQYLGAVAVEPLPESTWPIDPGKAAA